MENTIENTSKITPPVKEKIVNTVLWAKYGAIISFINLGLGFLQIVVGAIKGNASVFGTIFTFLISAVITLVMSINLYKYSKLAHVGIEHEDSGALYQALSHLRIYFTVMGVLFLIIIGLLLLLVIIGLIVALINFAN